MSRSLGQGSLFERLTVGAPPVTRRTHHRNQKEFLVDRVQAIKRHLALILNARQGCSASSPELGLPDFNDAVIGSASLQNQIGGHIREVVAAYEPRITVLDIQPVTDPAWPLNIHFRLDCLVPVARGEERVEIDLVVQHDTQITSIL